jgi:hypothetical protein
MDILAQIAQAIRTYTQNNNNRAIILGNDIIPIEQSRFSPIIPENNKTITFIDGGQAELVKAPNFSVQFIRIASCTWKGKERIDQNKTEFYLLIQAENKHGTAQGLAYTGKTFSINDNQLINDQDISFLANDPTLRIGTKNADISQIGNVVRRFAELSIASQAQSDIVVLDGTLDQTFSREQQFLEKLPNNVCALAKTSNLFTTNGAAAASVLNERGPPGAWNFKLTPTKSIVKLHPKTDYIFLFESNQQANEAIQSLASQSNDAVFLGYPYGLIWADKIARVSHEEASLLRTQLFVHLGKDAERIRRYTSSTTAHDVLDSIG